MFLNEQLDEIEQLIEKAHFRNTKVSKKGIDWHLDHSLKVLTNVPKVLRKSNPEDFKPNFNAMRSLIYAFNWIPRGKGKAPKSVQSFEVITNAQLQAQFTEAKKSLEILNSLHEKHHFKHPYFGVLNLKQSKKFLQIHTKHHLKICRDILK